MLHRVAEASLACPDDTVREVIYPVVGGETTLRDLLAEYRATGSEYQRAKRQVFKASYTSHYRRGLIRLLGVLEFHFNNATHRPMIDALDLIMRHAHSTARFYPADETVVVDAVVRPDWADLLVQIDSRGRVRTVYEVCVLQTLRERLRCREIGARRPRVAQRGRRPAGRLRGHAGRAVRQAAQAPGPLRVRRRDPRRTHRPQQRCRRWTGCRSSPKPPAHRHAGPARALVCSADGP